MFSLSELLHGKQVQFSTFICSGLSLLLFYLSLYSSIVFYGDWLYIVELYHYVLLCDEKFHRETHLH